MNPDDRRMLFAAIQILRRKEPSRYRLPIRSREMHKLWLDELRFVDAGGHRVGKTNRLRVCFRLDREEICAVARVRMLVDEIFVICRPMRLYVGAVSRGDVRDRGMRGIASDFGDANVAVARSVWLIRVECNSLAVVRPGGAPGFELPLRDLHHLPAGRWHNVQMIPAILITQKRNPPSVWRRPRLGSCLTPVRYAPKLLLGNLVDGARFPVGGVSDINRIFLEVFRFTVIHEVCCIYPGKSAVFSRSANCDRFAACDLRCVDLPRNVFPDAINNFLPRIGWSFVVIDRLGACGVRKAGAVGRPDWPRNANV